MVKYPNSLRSNAEVLDKNNYYPFGMVHNYTATTQNAYQYKYNGKELQETGMYDYGARFYMPDLGRWGVVDPLAEKMRRHSPYNYAFNNPIRFVDPDGRQNEDVIKIFNDGKIERTPDKNPYDTVTNQAGSESIQIARLNITENNPTGDSQIGDVQEQAYKTPGHSGKPGGKMLSYLEIKDNNVAKQFFEFAAANTKVEFGRDIYKFN